MNLPLGTRVGKKKPGSDSRFANKHGCIVGYGQKFAKGGRRQNFYIVELDGTTRTEEWAPSVVYRLESDFGTDNVAFT